MSEANGPAGEADNRAEANAAASEGSNGGGNEAWFSGLSEDNRAFAEAKNWASPDDALKSHRELEARLGKSITLPDEKDPPEKWDGIFQKLGAPEKPDGYEFNLDTEKVPEDFPYEKESADWFRNIAHEAKLTKTQAAKLHDAFVNSRVEQFTAAKEAEAKAAKEREATEEREHRNITAKWGDPDSPGYKEHVAWADRALRETGMKEAFEKAGLLGKDGVVLDAKAAFFLSEAGQKMFGEDGSANPLSRAEVSNPFAKDTRNVSKQSELVRLAKNDPQQREGVQRLIRQAGQDPSKFGL